MSARRRRWHAEIPTAELPDLPTTPPERDADSRAMLRSALAVLLPRQRAAVVLRYVADLDDAAVAAALGCSVSTVRSQISSALARLRQEPVPVPQGEQP